MLLALAACGQPSADSGGSATTVALPSLQATAHSDAASPLQPEAEDGLVDLRILVPDVLLDMRYASTNNFVGKPVYAKSRCLLRKPVAGALLAVQANLRKDNLQLLIWDCYRPFSVQEEFWKLVPNPRYVARPVREDGRPQEGSKHNRGGAVDLSLASLDGKPLLMPTDHDDFSERAQLGAKGVSAEATNNAKRLQQAMESAGFQAIESEWWHFDYQDWQDYQLSDEPL